MSMSPVFQEEQDEDAKLEKSYKVSVMLLEMDSNNAFGLWAVAEDAQHLLNTTYQRERGREGKFIIHGP